MKPNLADALSQFAGTLDSLDLKQPVVIVLENEIQGQRWARELTPPGVDVSANLLTQTHEMRFMDILIRWPIR